MTQKANDLLRSLDRLVLSVETEMGVIRRELVDLGSIRGQTASRLARVWVALARQGADEQQLDEIQRIGTDLHSTTFSTVQKQLNRINNQAAHLPLGRKPFSVVEGGQHEQAGDGRGDGQ